jgi:hypothetical protein
VAVSSSLGVGEGWDVPFEVKDRVAFHWFHVVPGSRLLLVMLSLRPLWYVGHFDKGRMDRCIGDGCVKCQLGVGKQLRYVISCAEMTTKRIGVIEISESVAALLKQWAVPNGGARGLILEFSKATKSKHSRMEIARIDEHPPAWAMAMEALDLHEVLANTWDRLTG